MILGECATSSSSALQYLTIRSYLQRHQISLLSSNYSTSILLRQRQTSTPRMGDCSHCHGVWPSLNATQQVGHLLWKTASATTPHGGTLTAWKSPPQSCRLRCLCEDGNYVNNRCLAHVSTSRMRPGSATGQH